MALRLARALHGAVVRRATVPVTMPAMSPTMTDGKVIRWAKKEGVERGCKHRHRPGDIVKPGDVLLEIQTDKATIDVESNDGGILAKILVPANSDSIAVNSLIALMVQEGDDWRKAQLPASVPPPATAPPAAAAPPPAKAPPAAAATAAAPQTAPQTPATAAPARSDGEGSDHHVTGLFPSVALLLQTHGLRPEQITGTGPHGRILKGDVLAAIERGVTAASGPAAPPPAPSAAPKAAPNPPAAKPAPAASASDYNDVALSNMRRIIARRLVESTHGVPHYYTSQDVDMSAVTQLREQLNKGLAAGRASQDPKDAVKLSVNDFVIKAAAVALQRVPDVNSVWTPNGAQRQPQIDISFAVALENGLITPIIRNVEGLGLADISKTVKTLATKARTNKLAPHEYQGGTFSVSNLGMYGVTHFTAVINPPQVAILAISATRQEAPRARFDEDAPLAAQTVLDPAKSRPIMTVTLSADARVVDPNVAAQFLSEFKRTLESGLQSAL